MFVVNRSAAGYSRGYLARTYCIVLNVYTVGLHTHSIVYHARRTLLFAQGRTPASQQMCARII